MKIHRSNMYVSNSHVIFNPPNTQNQTSRTSSVPACHNRIPSIKTNSCGDNDSIKKDKIDAVYNALTSQAINIIIGIENHKQALAEYGDEYPILLLSKTLEGQVKPRVNFKNLPDSIFKDGKFKLQPQSQPDTYSLSQKYFLKSFTYSLLCKGISANIHKNVIWMQYSIFNLSQGKNDDALKAVIQLTNTAYMMQELEIAENEQLKLFSLLHLLIKNNIVDSCKIRQFNQELITKIKEVRAGNITTKNINFHTIVERHFEKKLHSQSNNGFNITGVALAAGTLIGATLVKTVMTSKL